jgi:hypothetical protein
VAKDRVRAEDRGKYMIMDLISYKMVENLTKVAGQLPGYQLLLVLERAACAPSTAVLHNGAVKELTDSRLTRLRR